MFGVTVNAVAILLGTAIGLIFRKVINKEMEAVIMQAMGVAVLSIGIMDMLSVRGNITMILTLILSLTIGGAVGSFFQIQNRIEQFGEFLKKRLSKDENSTLGKAFTTSVLIFCIGAMVVYGSINAGLGDNSTLYIKSILDGVVSVITAATMGAGVALSAVVVFVLQGIFALSASFLNPILVAYPDVKTMLTGIGGVLVMCIGINLLELKKMRTGDLIPALLGCLVMMFF
ncbi:MAG: DUF554 domain-containing protein [Lachnospiraceae bacterium]